MDPISNKIKKLRNKKNMSQTDLAKKLNVTKQAVSKWETNRGYPDSQLLPVLADELGVSLDFLLGDDTKYLKKKLVLIISIVLLLILITAISPIIFNEVNIRKEYNEYSNNIEQIITIEIPNRGELVSINFNNWNMFGNEIEILTMQYFVFSESKQVTDFEQLLSESSKWNQELDIDIINLIPNSIIDYTNKGDLFLIYNKDMLTYNELNQARINDEIFFIIYQLEENRLIIFTYSYF